MKKRKLRFSVDDTINNFLGKPTRIVAVALLLVIVLFPLYWLVSNSFKMESEYLKSPPVMVPSRVTMENYIHIFKNVGAGRSLFNTVCVAVLRRYAACSLAALRAMPSPRASCIGGFARASASGL